MIEDEILFQEIRKGNTIVYTFLFKKYYKDLVIFAGNYVLDKDVCEDFVQNLFLKIWNERENININTSFRSFLLKSIQNACLDYIRHQQVVKNLATKKEIFEVELGLIDPERYTLYSELHDKLDSALNRLPNTYKQVFILNKLEGMKHKEISKQLNISERTVEDRISKALILLRKYLKDFLISSIIFLF